eukprot:CAMPEP_0178894260 /NCGR_PEP_ID=MMETSP0747-20121128/20463_1 /TAXON_ID=913974 /ORGANISM="Nitzschia punctata, Strain CCMP561" /LENGTH=168 /DNA_ID=CAMNT_0020564331 /DNA_START=396 /DNA_END=902 /DNA_ORIENTATION=+
MVQQNEILYVTKISRNDVHAKSKWPNPFPWPGFDVFKQLILENLNSFHFDSDTKFQIKMQVCTWGPSGVKDSLLRNSPVGKSADFLGEGVHKGRVIQRNVLHNPLRRTVSRRWVIRPGNCNRITDVIRALYQAPLTQKENEMIKAARPPNTTIGSIPKADSKKNARTK